MDLYFSRRDLFETAFHIPCGKSPQEECKGFREVYRVSTTVRARSILLHTTTIEFVGAEDEEKHYVVATIRWCWPGQNSSTIEIDGNRFTLNDFMKRENGLFNTGTHIMIDDERFTWRSAVCRPAQLFDAQNRSVARFTPQAHGLQPRLRTLIVQPGCLHLEPDVATDAYARDFAVASFFVYRACRNLNMLLLPWYNAKRADSASMRTRE